MWELTLLLNWTKFEKEWLGSFWDIEGQIFWKIRHLSHIRHAFSRPVLQSDGWTPACLLPSQLLSDRLKTFMITLERLEVERPEVGSAWGIGRIAHNAYFVTSCLIDACTDRRNMWEMRGKWQDVLAVKKLPSYSLMKKIWRWG
jgi:hypothetical protein